MERIKTDDERRASLPVLSRERLRAAGLVINLYGPPVGQCRCIVVPADPWVMA